MDIIQKTDNWQGCGELEPSYIAGGTLNEAVIFGKHLAVSYNAKYRFPIEASDSTPSCIPKRNENICPHEKLLSDCS